MKGRRRAPWYWICAVVFLMSMAQGCGLKARPKPAKKAVPEPPTALKAEVEAEGVRLSFILPERNTDGSGLTDLEIIEVQRAMAPGDECPTCPVSYSTVGEIRHRYVPGEVLPKGRMSFLDKLDRAGLYRYRAVAVNSESNKSRPSAAITVFWDVPPEAPREIIARPGEGRVDLSWTRVERTADGRPLETTQVFYQVFRGREGAEIATTPLNPGPLPGASYTDVAVQNGVSYSYRVRALKRVGDRFVPGPLSEPVVAMPQRLEPPAPPAGLVAFPTTTGVRLVWEGGPGKGVSGYRVYRAEDPQGPWEQVNTETVVTPYFDDTPPKRGRPYWYSVTTLDDSNPPWEGQRSGPVRVHVPAEAPLRAVPEPKRGP